MGFNSSGIYTRLEGRAQWQDDAAANVKIEADLHDAHDNDLGDSLSQTILKDGRSVITSDISWNGKKITNVGTATADTDVPQYAQVKNWKEFSTGMTITGSDANGRITFNVKATGVTGFNWVVADISWLAKPAEASKALPRLVMNNSGAANSGLVTGGAGSDVFIIDDAGRINNSGVLSNNLSYDGAAWRTISPGTGTQLQYTGGAIGAYSNDVATITNPYATNTQRQFFGVTNSAGTTIMELDKSASGKAAYIISKTGTEARWLMYLGDTAAESSTRTGSNFSIFSYDNTGAAAFAEMSINRSTHLAAFGGAITAAGTVTSSSGFASSTTNIILSGTGASGAVYLRPRGQADGTGQFTVDNVGNTSCTGQMVGGTGYRCRTGSGGSYGTNTFNFHWDGTYVLSYIDNTFMGAIFWQSDYRFKRDIAPLPSMWDKVKSLAPISYKQKEWGLFKDDPEEKWGFVAHELQDRLTHGAALGEKDAVDAVQQINPMTLIAALTRALQEAMARIEALEGATP